jgi:hypothetical protein
MECRPKKSRLAAAFLFTLEPGQMFSRKVFSVSERDG